MLTLLVSSVLSAASAAPLRLDDVTWRADRDRAGGLRLTIARRGGSSNGDMLDERLADGSTLRQILNRGDGAVTFSLIPEAGTLACHGELRAARGAGHCRFVSNAAFEIGLANRAIPLKSREQLLELAVTGARLARADGLAAAGFPMRNGNDLVAATALDVTDDYARSLKQAGLAVRDLNDLVACRALKIDAIWVRGFAAAGYRLDARRAIAMKAVGVTPEYARAVGAGGAK